MKSARPFGKIRDRESIATRVPVAGWHTTAAGSPASAGPPPPRDEILSDRGRHRAVAGDDGGLTLDAEQSLIRDDHVDRNRYRLTGRQSGHPLDESVGHDLAAERPSQLTSACFLSAA